MTKVITVTNTSTGKVEAHRLWKKKKSPTKAEIATVVKEFSDAWPDDTFSGKFETYVNRNLNRNPKRKFSAKQIAAQKRFAAMAKAGKFSKRKKSPLAKYKKGLTTREKAAIARYKNPVRAGAKRKPAKRNPPPRTQSRYLVRMSVPVKSGYKYYYLARIYSDRERKDGVGALFELDRARGVEMSQSAATSAARMVFRDFQSRMKPGASLTLEKV